MNWWSGFEQICQPDAPLVEHTWYGLGGPARWLFTPRDEDELAALLARCGQCQIPWRILGRGANVLVRDAGVDAAVIKLTHVYWERTQIDPPTVTARAGADLPRLVRTTIDRGLVGLERLAGIPGTIGGATRMNAGGKYGYLGDFLRRVRIVQPDGQRRLYARDELALGYRTSNLNGGVVSEVTLELAAGDRDAAMQRFRAIWTEKYATQPPVSARSAGCIFKNPPGHAAGKLIDEAGLKGTRCGGAEISTRHANFIIAHPGATAGDVLTLIDLARKRVRDQTGVELELEIEIW